MKRYGLVSADLRPLGVERYGFALVTSLLVMLVIAALGASAVFLTQMNLRIAENTRAHAIAKANANSGLERSFVVLATYVTQNGPVLPDTVEALTEALSTSALWAPSGDGGYDEYRLLVERFEHVPGDEDAEIGDRVRLAIEGGGPRSARYEVEALVRATERLVLGGPPGSIGLRDGITAEGDIDLNGNGVYNINFTSGSNINIHPGSLTTGRTAVSEGSCVVGPGRPKPCPGVLDEPVKVDPPVFEEVLDLIVAGDEESEPPREPIDLESCRGSAVTSIPDNATGVYCLAPGASVSINGSVQNLTVIGDETTSVEVNAQTGDPSNSDVVGLTVASGTVTFSGDSPFYGYNTVLAVEDIVFGKDVVSNDNTARTLIITEGDFTLNGTGRSAIYAAFWIGGDFHWNGTPSLFRGSVLAKGSVTGNGCGGDRCNIAPPEEFDFTFDPETGGGTIVSRGLLIDGRR